MVGKVGKNWWKKMLLTMMVVEEKQRDVLPTHIQIADYTHMVAFLGNKYTATPATLA